MNPYDIIAQQIPETTFDTIPWNMHQWHPEGAHFEYCGVEDLHIVVTDWTTEGHADVCVYRSLDSDPIEYWQIPLQQLGVRLVEILHRDVTRWNPLPAPWPSAVEIAAIYIAEVRANGPEFMANVGNAHNDGTDFEISYEIAETWSRHNFATIDWMGNEDDAQRADLILAKAAGLAIETFAAELL